MNVGVCWKDLVFSRDWFVIVARLMENVAIYWRMLGLVHLLKLFLLKIVKTAIKIELNTEKIKNRKNPY